MSTTPRLATAAVALGLAAATIAAPAASAQSAPHHRAPHHHSRHDHRPPASREHVLASGLLSPLRAAVTRSGTAYVSENFAGKIDRVGLGGTRTTVYTEPHGFEVGGLSVSGRNVIFTVTQSVGQGQNLDSWLKVLTPSGQVRTIADLHAYEAAANPDQHTTYGFRSTDSHAPAPGCLAKWPTSRSGPATYTGAVDSHPYATYALGNGWTLVADAGGNDVLAVSPRGEVRTVATLPAIPFRITAAAAGGMGLDACFVGATYWFEPVPTDVEMGHDGVLYVTSLPGGPEGPQLGGRGSVFAIDTQGRDHGHHGRWMRPAHRHGGGDGGYGMFRAHRVVGGLVDPTGLAVGPDGSLYVAQLFGDTISRVMLGRHGAWVRDVISTPSPGEVEWTRWGLYFTDNVLSGTPEDPHGHTTVPMGRLVRYGG